MNDILAVGVAPDIMGVGPAYAIPDALKKANLTVKQHSSFYLIITTIMMITTISSSR